MKRQSPEQVVRLDDWELDPDHPFPDGSKPKNAFFCPASGQPAFLRPGHRYLFKKSRVIKGWHSGITNPFETQYWAEVIAYRVGCLAGIDVPPAFVAVRDQQCGALIEWFHLDDAQRVTSGTDEMEKFISGFDRDTGRQHNLHTLEKVCRLYWKSLDGHWSHHWSKIFLFDALIANTDRHQENWGIVWETTSGSASWTPAFDNGTSMGFEFPEGKLTQQSIENHTRRGHHHIRENPDSGQQFGHLELVKYWVCRFPATRTIMQACLAFSMNELKQALSEFTQYCVPVPFTPERASFVYKLIDYRRERLIAILGS